MTTIPQSPKRAVLYARISTKEQAEKGYSMAQQLDALRSYCEREGVEIVGVYEDPGRSGAYLERPGLDSLRERVAEGGVHFVLAQDRDRFARDPILVGLLRYEFEEHGARLKSIQDAYDDTPEGELTSGILDQIAAFERKQIAKRMWRGRRQRAWEGKIIAGNSAPYGFSFNSDRTNLVVNDSEMFTVRRVFEMVGCRGMSLNATRLALEDGGVLTPRGRREWQRIVLRT